MTSRGLPRHKRPSSFSPIISSGLETIKRDGKARGESKKSFEAPLSIATPPPRYLTRSSDHYELRYHPYKIDGDGLTTPRRPEADASALAESARERKIPVRSGKWHPEEDAYLRRLVELFNAGVLDDMPAKATMRGWLAKMLNCCPMRISKKQSHGEKFEGKVKYVRDVSRINRMTQTEYDVTRDHIARLRAEFLKSWAKDEIVRRSVQTEEMTFEEWYSQVVLLVPTPRVARNKYIDGDEAVPFQKPWGVQHLRQQLEAEAKNFAFIHGRGGKNLQSARRKLNSTTITTKRTFGMMLDADIKVNKSSFRSSSSPPSSSFSASDVSTASECFVDMLTRSDDAIKQEMAKGKQSVTPFGHTEPSTETAFHSSQPFPEDCIADHHHQPSMGRPDAFDGADSARYKLPVLRFDLSDFSNATPSTIVEPDDGESQTLGVAVSHPACESIIGDPTAPTGNDGDSALDEIPLLSTDTDLFSLDEIPLDSWLYESLTASSPP